jgi:hypothetical protein
MTRQERQLVDELFERLANLESIPRDPDAERPRQSECKATCYPCDKTSNAAQWVGSRGAQDYGNDRELPGSAISRCAMGYL